MPHLTKNSSFRRSASFSCSRLPVLQHKIYIYDTFNYSKMLQMVLYFYIMKFVLFVGNKLLIIDTYRNDTGLYA